MESKKVNYKNSYWLCMREDMSKDKVRFIPIARIEKHFKGENGIYLKVPRKTILL